MNTDHPLTESSRILKYLAQRSKETHRSGLSLAILLDENERGGNNDIILSLCKAVKSSSFTISATHQSGLFSAGNSHLSAKAGDLIYVLLRRPKPLFLRPGDGTSYQFSIIGSNVILQMIDGRLQSCYYIKSATITVTQASQWRISSCVEHTTIEQGIDYL